MPFYLLQVHLKNVGVLNQKNWSLRAVKARLPFSILQLFDIEEVTPLLAYPLFHTEEGGILPALQGV